jgi:hypothetical protein
MSADSVKRAKPAREFYHAVASAFDVELAQVGLVAARSWDVSCALTGLPPTICGSLASRCRRHGRGRHRPHRRTTQAAHHRHRFPRRHRDHDGLPGDTCSHFPGKRYEDWQLIDSAGQSIDVVRGIRDDIRQRVQTVAEDPLHGA